MGERWLDQAKPVWEVAMPRFVIQEQQGRRHHFDFRLEKEGVFKSWAVPRGLPANPRGVRREPPHSQSVGATTHTACQS